LNESPLAICAIEVKFMQSEQEQFDRRSFLRLSGAGAAIAGTSALFPSLLFAKEEQVQPTERLAPVNPVRLRSSVMEVVLDRNDGLPFAFHLTGNEAALRGEDFGRKICATTCQKTPLKFAQLEASSVGNRTTPDTADFHFEMRSGSTTAASFTLRYRLAQASITITLENVKESQGYELISVDLPCLVSVREEDPDAWLVHGDAGGSFAMLRNATAGALAPNQFWGNISGTLPVVMLGTSTLLCVQEVTAFMDGTSITVIGEDGKRRASIGTSKTYRVNGGDCYDLNLGKAMPRNCGTSSTPNMLVEQKSSCRLDFLPVTGDVRKAWLAGAKLVRSRMPPIRSDLYHDKYVYGIRCDEPLFPKPTATFADCEQLIRDVNSLTDSAAQIVHLWGWQFKGKDTGYPAVNEVDQRIGGYDGMMRLMGAGPALNAIVTLSDNYDDAYRSSPAWNENLVARRPDGELWKSRSWTGEQSYILGLAKYMDGPGVERVRYTCERYKLQKTTHIDVLSYYAIRNDWDRTRPASGIRNLTDGRYRVLEEFAKRDVDVSSEALRYPMIGHISNFWYAQFSSACPFAGTIIPLLPLIYRKSAVWGYSGGSKADHAFDRISQFFYGGCPHSILRGDTDRKQITDTWYLDLLPWFHLHTLNIESFDRERDRVTISLEGNSRIMLDWANKSYSIVLNGMEVARNESTFCPVGNDRIAFYSLTQQTLTATLPSGWKAEEMAAAALSTEKRIPVDFLVDGNQVKVSANPQQPVMVYRRKEVARLP
jgi:Endo-alpha-N-acetylgalactosaminidase